MPATTLKENVDLCVKLIGEMKPQILDGPLDRHTITFKVCVSDKSGAALKKSSRDDFENRSHAQQIWYKHSQTKAEGSLRDIVRRRTAGRKHDQDQKSRSRLGSTVVCKNKRGHKEDNYNKQRQIVQQN